MRSIRGRLERGEKEYGHVSYTFEERRLFDEIEQELLDVCGWSYFLWRRMQGLRDALAKRRRRPRDKRVLVYPTAAVAHRRR